MAAPRDSPRPIEVHDRVRDADVQDGDDEERKDERDDRVDALRDRDERIEIREWRTDLVTVRRHRHYVRRPSSVIVEQRRKQRQTGNDQFRPTRRAQNVTLQRKLNRDVAFDGEADDVPDAEEAWHVRDVGEGLTQSRHRIKVDSIEGRLQPEEEDADQEANVGDAESCQVDVRRYALHVPTDEDDERDEISDETADDYDRNHV